jgi:uncharacterized protein
MRFSFIIFVVSVLLLSCSENHSPEYQSYLNEVKESRIEKDNYMRDNPSSPFNQDERADFSPLNYYPVDKNFIFKSRLYEFENKDTVIVLGTRGEERKTVRYGRLDLNYNNQPFKLNVYEGKSRSGAVYHSLWFTDKTTGEETYGVGRYLDFEINPDKDFIYTIDFNYAYNPYCAYSAKYSCAIPTREDYIDIAIKAGEKNFH